VLSYCLIWLKNSLQGLGKFPRLACVVMAVERKKALIREEAYLGLLAFLQELIK